MKLNNIEDAPSVGCVYIIENTITKQKYCGQTKNLKQRLHAHVNVHSKNASSSCNSRTDMYKDFFTYGIDMFVWSVHYLSECPIERLAEEKIVKRNSDFNLYSHKESKRDTSKKHNMKRVMLKSKGKDLVFKSPISVTNFFRTERSNILRALKGEYRYLKKYEAFYISEDEYQAKIGQKTLFQ